MTDDTDRLNEIRERLIPGPQYCISRSFSDIPWLLGKIDRLRTDANLACADLAEANRTIAELREQVKLREAARNLLAYLYIWGAAPTDRLAELCNQLDIATKLRPCGVPLIGKAQAITALDWALDTIDGPKETK